MLEVSNSIPVPSGRGTTGSKYPFESLTTFGQSFGIPLSVNETPETVEKLLKSIKTTAAKAGKSLGCSFVVRSRFNAESNPEIRVWRIDKRPAYNRKPAASKKTKTSKKA